MGELKYKNGRIEYDGSELATKQDVGATHYIADGDLSGRRTGLLYDSNFPLRTVESSNHSKAEIGRNIIAMNHDDLYKSDYKGISKIYAKYGFHASFNFILRPFNSIDEMNDMIVGIKQVIADGNDIGLHAVMQESAWWMNKMYDVRPDETFTFAPTLSELQTLTNGKNIFNHSVNASTLLEGGESRYVTVPSTLRNVKMLELTQSQLVALTKNYCVYFMTDKASGIDLDGNMRTLSWLGWLEYWYNELIDSSLGYSSDSEITSIKYAEDYVGTYPAASELLSGNITSNGRFVKGLFKGCASCCNYEVADRMLEIALAFCKHYFGLDRFRNMGRHGVRFANTLFYDSNGVPFDNREKTVLSGEFGKVYRTRQKDWVTEHDILLNAGIRTQNHNTPLGAIFESQVGMYYGQSGLRSDFFNSCSGTPYCLTQYFDFVGDGDYAGYDQKKVSYEDYMKFVDGIDDVIAFAYEHADETLTRGGVTLKVHRYIKLAIDAINGSFETNKIPCFSLDTINSDCSTFDAINALCAYCYKNGICIVTMEEARKAACTLGILDKQNQFPNPAFSQIAMQTIPNATTPSGWRIESKDANSLDFNVDGERALSVHINGKSAYISTLLYGLKSGHYKLSYKAKADGSEGLCRVRFFLKKNSDTIGQYYFDGQSHFNPLDDNNVTSEEYSEHEVSFVIPEKFVDNDGSVAAQYSKGLQNNVVCVMLRIELISTNQTNGSSFGLYIKAPKLKVG